eukprot:349677-Chlamydomonas_euryale.AAC.6
MWACLHVGCVSVADTSRGSRPPVNAFEAATPFVTLHWTSRPVGILANFMCPMCGAAGMSGSTLRRVQAMGLPMPAGIERWVGKGSFLDLTVAFI